MSDNNGLSIREERPELISLDAAVRTLAELRDFTEVKQVFDQAETFRYWVRRRRLGRAAALDAAEIKIWAERRMGQLLAELPKNVGAAGSGSNQHEVRLNDETAPPTLAELGTNKCQSCRCQKIARVDESAIREAIDKVRDDDKGDLTTTGILRLAKELDRDGKRKKNREVIERAESVGIDGTFETIAIDPPWDWGDEGDVSQLGRGDPTYQTASFEQLLSPDWWRRTTFRRPIPEAAEKNAHLYLWITNRSLPKGFALMDAWGFRYVTCLTWCKPSYGMGNYFRGSTEHVLFGVRGSLPLLRNDVGTHFAADRQGKHSTKPDEFYRLVETCSPGPWLEMFARRQRPGWACWGAEA